jgi:hypothetical protein
MQKKRAEEAGEEGDAVNLRTFALWCLILGPVMLVAEALGLARSGAQMAR